MVGWSRKSYLGLPEIVSFSRQDFSRSSKHGTSYMLHRLGISKFYFCELLLFQIFLSWKFKKT